MKRFKTFLDGANPPFLGDLTPPGSPQTGGTGIRWVPRRTLGAMGDEQNPTQREAKNPHEFGINLLPKLVLLVLFLLRPPRPTPKRLGMATWKLRGKFIKNRINLSKKWPHGEPGLAGTSCPIHPDLAIITIPSETQVVVPWAFAGDCHRRVPLGLL